jgi:hypothetical protein
MKKTTKKKLRRRIKRKLATALPATAKEVHVHIIGGGGGGGSGKVSHLTHWRTKAGEVVSLRDMEINHLINARELVTRRITRMQEVCVAMSREISRRLLAIQDTANYPDARDVWDAYGGNGEMTNEKRPP